ncbi:MAG: hypothetical protein PHO42_01465 [Candidatus Omnitrophica bacterium]|nr:hypothetical protein [Candidatus Omnitrophota bacterium]
MKKNWLYYFACVLAPHIMLVVGLIYLTRQGRQRVLGKRLCAISTIVLIVGSLAYYIFFTPIFGLD